MTLKIYSMKMKRTDSWHRVFLWKNVSFKESSPSIMVTRNPNWSTEILWFRTGCGSSVFFNTVLLKIFFNWSTEILSVQD